MKPHSASTEEMTAPPESSRTTVSGDDPVTKDTLSRSVSRRDTTRGLGAGSGAETAWGVGVVAFFSLLFGAPGTAIVADQSGVLGVTLLWLGLLALNFATVVLARGRR
ncbi:hypothetical protein [Nocardiopsis ansamitocini]|uniref:Uncharacterized protein n=1 Tax=Nocardiopsis ansamitocini TaxID=1670832 RepID=A0A9W6UGT2_9ACTN|nr:hypothetical protein [Nocardiopsis ansamitocini]GLU45784.1 hypothetical protein Nans01_01350 [Nocardiopsis ansamitocini]